MKHSALNTPRLAELRRKRQKALRNKVIFYGAIILILLSGLAFASRIKKININNIEISGNKVIDTESIRQVANETISGHYLWIFPKTNFIIYPRHQLEKNLAEKFKRFKNISIDVKNFRTLSINVDEHEGKYLWCGELIPVLRSDLRPESSKCYFLDDSGYIFDEAPFFSGQVYFKFYGWLNSDKPDPSGINFIPQYFTKVIELKEALEKMNLKPTAFYELGGVGHENEGFISLGGEPGISAFVTFKIDSDYPTIIENLRTALSAEPLATDIKNKFDSLSYIDLKFGNKVYYKFK